MTDPVNDPSQDQLENASFDRLADPSRGKKGASPSIGRSQGVSRDCCGFRDDRRESSGGHRSEWYLKRAMTASRQSATTMDDGRSV